jgi:HPt (histidine-containing phosphotransfer) domain-containing protein
MTSSARLDPTVISELIDLGPETGLQLVQDLVEIFNAEVPSRITAMRGGLEQHNLQDIARAAHAMRGGAGNLGAFGIGELCSVIESHATAGEAEPIGPLIDEMERELVLVQEALAVRLAGLK